MEQVSDLLRYSGKNPMRFAVFWRISVRFYGFRTPLTPLSIQCGIACEIKLHGDQIFCYWLKELMYYNEKTVVAFWNVTLICTVLFRLKYCFF